MAAAIETIAQVPATIAVSNNSQEQYQPSFFRRAWDKLENILAQVQNKSIASYLSQDDDDIHEEEFHNPLNPHRRQIFKEGSIRSRISTDSDDRLSSSRTSSRASSLRHFDPWQQRINEELQQAQMEHAQIKNMISGWASNEVGPWFDY
ncbi:10124_t:CDS:2 [Ambispora gerdemannii]|uniref:10124_t:CDS:1 n=1 Tax=Ambispora gerdemannii TaxID=144530 RepID=A0A9N8ZAT1_9GLOM|nr:10124_t:CDS:2 [Ambispora gerdemannii]